MPEALFRPRLAISLGDPNGIGPEVVLKTLSDPRLLKYHRPVVVGSLSVLRRHAERLGYADLEFHALESPELADLPEEGIGVLDLAPGQEPEIRWGEITAEAGRQSMFAVEVAADLCLAGHADGMVTAPISKEAVNRAGYAIPGHTEFLAGRSGNSRYTMMMVSGELRVGLVTTHLPLREVPERITQAAIVEKLEILQDSLRRDFGKSRPQIAVLGLNPHAGDGGVIGKEEVEVIGPTIERARAGGILASGPFPADGFFGSQRYARYDAVLAMYHDQGLGPFKALSFNAGINFTAGLPIVRTSPDHGTGFDIAGEGKANPDSFRHAVYLAIDVARRRRG